MRNAAAQIKCQSSICYGRPIMTNLLPKPCNLSPATPTLRSTLALET